MLKIEKLTENFTLEVENNRYVLDYGDLKLTDNKEVVFKIYATDLTIVPECGCTNSDKREEDGVTIATIKYKNCDSSFGKIVNITEKNKKDKTQIKIKGKCQR